MTFEELKVGQRFKIKQLSYLYEKIEPAKDSIANAVIINFKGDPKYSRDFFHRSWEVIPQDGQF